MSIPGGEAKRGGLIYYVLSMLFVIYLSSSAFRWVKYDVGVVYNMFINVPLLFGGVYKKCGCGCGIMVTCMLAVPSSVLLLKSQPSPPPTHTHQSTRILT